MRGSSTMRNSRKLAPTGLGGGVVGGVASKLNARRLSGTKLSSLIDNNPTATDLADQKSRTGGDTAAATTGKVEARVTRSASKRRQLSAETVGRIRERRALRAIQNNARSQPSVRSLPATVVSSTSNNGSCRRRSVRR